MGMMKRERSMVFLRLTCLNPSECFGDQEPTVFGLQDRHQAVHAGQVHADGSVSYEIEVPVTRNDETSTARFQGLYIHGTSSLPFLYLSLKHLETEPASWVRRLKIPLPHLTWDQIASTSGGPPTFVARVSGMGSGTVPLLDGGWMRHDPSSAS